MDVSVLVPVRNEAGHLRDTLAGMRAQTYPGPIEFLFIDGGSTDASREIIAEAARQDQRIRLLENPDATTPRALNTGLRAATGEFVARMDAHTRYPSHYLEVGIERLRRGDVVSVSGPQVAVGYDRWSRRVALALGSPLGVGGARSRRVPDAELEVDSGFTGLWRRSVLLDQGGWDDHWVGDEDYELAARLREAGGRIVSMPEMAAQYAPRNSLPALGRQYWSYGLARVRTSRRHPESLRPSQVLPAATVLTVIAATLGPKPVARPARAGTFLYLASIVGESGRSVIRGTAAGEAAKLPAIFVTMHLSYGFGALAGLAAYGVPVAALTHAGRTLGARVGRQLRGRS